MPEANSVFSDDAFFVYGLCGLLSREFLNEFFIVFDLDCQYADEDLTPVSEDEEVVAFVSNDVAFYQAEKFGLPHVLDKKRSVQDMLDFLCLSVIAVPVTPKEI